jgi:hypothetical protein
VFDFQAADRKLNLKRQKLMPDLKPDMVFVRNPLFRLKRVYFDEEKGQAVVVKSVINKCGLIKSSRRYGGVKVGDKDISTLMGFFDGENTLGQIKRKSEQELDLSLSGEQFVTLVWMFSEEGIIIYKSPDWGSGEHNEKKNSISDNS